MSLRRIVEVKEVQSIEEAVTETFACDICDIEVNVNTIIDSKNSEVKKDMPLEGWISVTGLSQAIRSKIYHICKTCAVERLPEFYAANGRLPE
jgi:hypothetical protein